MLSHLTIPDIGGLQLDSYIANYLNTQFMAKHNKNASSNLKSQIKLLTKAKQVKEILSANR
jgi:molecular chaperone DnaK (HSP70)